MTIDNSCLAASGEVGSDMVGDAVDIGSHGLRGIVAGLELTTMPIALTVCSSAIAVGGVQCQPGSLYADYQPAVRNSC